MDRLRDKVVIVTGGAQGHRRGHRSPSRLRKAPRSSSPTSTATKAKAVAASMTLKGKRATGAISVQVDVAESRRRCRRRFRERSWTASAGSTSCSTTPASTSRFRFLEVDEGELQQHHARQHHGACMLGITGSRASQMIAQGRRRQDHQHGFDRWPAGLCGVCALLLRASPR